MKTMTKILMSIFLLANLHIVKAEKSLDFDGDSKSDFAVTRYRNNGGTNLLDWYIARSSDNSVFYRQFGLGINGGSFDTRIPADFDGDNKTDIAVWRHSTMPEQSFFYILNSSDSTIRIEQFGQLFDDVSVTGDYDGDGKADLAVYRIDSQFQQQNHFIYRGSLNNPNRNLTYVPFGSGFINPYKGNFDGDGKLDFCVRSGSLFILKRSSDSGVEYINWGLSGDQRAPGDFDGDGKTDFCVLRFNGTALEWYILERDGGGTGASPIVWGISSDSPISNADYDGDGKTDIAIWRFNTNPSSTFFIRKSSNGSMLAYQLGLGGDTAVSE